MLKNGVNLLHIHNITNYSIKIYNQQDISLYLDDHDLQSNMKS